MEYLIGAAILAALIALTVVAFRSPELYKKIYWPLVIVAMLVFLGNVVWNISSSTTVSALIPYLEDGAIAEALAAAESVTLPGLWSSLVYLAAVIYLGLLAAIPSRLGNKALEEKRSGN